MVTLSRSRAKPSIQQVLPIFKALLPAAVVEGLMQASGARFYRRLFTPLVVIWCFIFQRLNADHSLDAVVSHVSSGAVDDLDDQDRPPISERIVSECTAAISKARKRIPLSVVQGVVQQVASVAEQDLGEETRWCGHLVFLLDGTTLLLRPEAELVEHYGQAENQHGCSYWVVMRVVAAFGLPTGLLPAVAEGSQRDSEQFLAKSVLAQLPPGSVCVGDSNFGVFSVVQAARHYNTFPVVRLTASRAQALAGRKLRPNEDLRVSWAPSRSDQLDPQMSQAPIDGRLIYVHLERDGFRPVHLYLFTTLLDVSGYPLAELVTLYGYRWQVELDLRSVKSTMDMDLLTAKSVDTVRKELWGGFAAYNIVRACMLMAAQEAGLAPLDLSFAKCWRRVWDAVRRLPDVKTPRDLAKWLSRLLKSLAKCRLQKRTRFRVEPRAVRKHPSIYPHLKGSRGQARQRARQKLLAELSKA